MGLKSKYRIFFAIPFDSATKSLYEDVKRKLMKKYSSLTIIIGNEETGPSPKYSNIASFKAQNADLFRQFISEIQKADIVVADLTHNNPNVHVELGIALYMNKNILRVTGRALTELGFDIRNYEVYRYGNKENLFKNISEYMDIFFQIKNLTFSEKNPSLYKFYPEEKQLNGKDKGFKMHTLPDVRLRDGKIQTQFKFTDQRKDNDWFGIYIRFVANQFIYSCLAYVRKNGWVEIAEYPGPEILCKKQLAPFGITNEETILVEVENNLIRVTIKNKCINYDKLRYQSQGKIGLACWYSNVIFKNVKVLCQDTIDTFENLQ